MNRLATMLDALTKDELVGLARAAELRGRSTMTKAELKTALMAHLGTDGPAAPAARADRRPNRCQSINNQHPCGLPAAAGSKFCGLHGGYAVSDLAIPVAGKLGFDTWPALLRQLALATYDVDPLGLDPVVADMVWHLINFLYVDYFRVEVEGIEHVPSEGAGILVANHAGAALPYDGAMLAAAVANEAAVPRRVRLIGTEIFNMFPFVSHLYRKSGSAYAARDDAIWVLEQGHLLGVFPEGVAGFQKPQDQAYQTQRFGRGGFVDLAFRTGAKIVPVAIVGGEEVHPVLFTSKRLAQLVRMVFPEQRVEEMAVWLNPLPLPIKWKLRFLPPIDVSTIEHTDRLAVLEISEAVRTQIQYALNAMLGERDSLF